MHSVRRCRSWAGSFVVRCCHWLSLASLALTFFPYVISAGGRRRRGHALLSSRSHCHSCSERLLRRRRRLPRCRGSRRRRRSCRVEPLLRPWYLLVRMAARGRRAHRAALPPSGRGFLMRRRAGISFPVIGARIRGRHLLAAGRGVPRAAPIAAAMIWRQRARRTQRAALPL